MVITFIFLGLSWYKTFKAKQRVGKWSVRMLYGTTILSIGLVIFTMLYR